MRKARNNNNFIDKTFTILADVLLRVFPASQQEKKSTGRMVWPQITSGLGRFRLPYPLLPGKTVSPWRKWPKSRKPGPLRPLTWVPCE